VSGRRIPEIDLRDQDGSVHDQLSGSLLRSLQSAYDLGEWLEWWHIRRSGSNDSFFITTTRGEFVLRRSHERKTEAGMEFEVKLLEHLCLRGYRAPRVISTRRGKSYVHIGGHPRAPGNTGSYFLLMEWIPGCRYDPGNPAHLREAGRALARYHRAVGDFSARFRPEGRPVPPALEWNGPSVLSAFARIADAFLDAGGKQRLTRACSYLWSQFIRVPEALSGVQTALPQLVIQASFGPSALVYDGDAVAGVVDYDRAGYDIRALDLAYAVEAFAGIEKAAAAPSDVGFDLELCARMMAAYAELEPLHPNELEALPLVFRAQRLVTVMSATSTFLRCHEAGGSGVRSVERIVDVAGTEAEELRWLEEHEPALRHALSSALVTPARADSRKG
jgi:Ser/Thr protein kinase RdoA (MazF antagonist)